MINARIESSILLYRYTMRVIKIKNHCA